MRIALINIVAATVLAASLARAADDPVRFWVSASNTSPTVSEAPTITAAVGQPRTLYVWGQPGTDGTGASRVIQNFSLDVVTQAADLNPEPQPFIDFVDGSFQVYNPLIGALPRFQYTSDSARIEELGGPLLSEKSATQVTNGEPDAIRGLQGLLLAAGSGLGIGQPNDPYRVGTAWLIAEFQITPLQSMGSNLLFLQIGYTGLVSAGTGTTQVMLGDDATPLYDAGNTSHRQKNLPGDTYDVRILAAASIPGDYDGDGAVEPGDYNFWRSSFGQTVAPGSGADGNGNGTVDAADYVFWRQHAVSVAVQASLAISTGLATWDKPIPEPSSGALLLLLIAPVCFTRDVYRV